MTRATYQIMITDILGNSKTARKIILGGKTMNTTWRRFNTYAKSRGFNKVVQGDFFGALAWENVATREIMELIPA